jgi:hypothetical protein
MARRTLRPAPFKAGVFCWELVPADLIRRILVRKLERTTDATSVTRLGQSRCRRCTFLMKRMLSSFFVPKCKRLEP